MDVSAKQRRIDKLCQVVRHIPTNKSYRVLAQVAGGRVLLADTEGRERTAEWVDWTNANIWGPV